MRLHKLMWGSKWTSDCVTGHLYIIVWCRFYRALFSGHAEGARVGDAILDTFKEKKYHKSILLVFVWMALKPVVRWSEIKLESNYQKFTKEWSIAMRTFIVKLVGHFQKKLPLCNSPCSSLGCLNPLSRNGDQVESVIQIQEVAWQLEPEHDVAGVADEQEWCQVGTVISHPHDDMRVEHNWRKVFQLTSGEHQTRYPISEPG